MINRKQRGFLIGYCLVCLLFSFICIIQAYNYKIEYEKIKTANDKLKHRIYGLEQTVEMYKFYTGESIENK